jgi:peptidoglycan hydrolase-like protein with peptidoglycan-binding domain
MTPRQARIALCSFLLLAAGVAVNALFLQTRPALVSRAVVEAPLPRSGSDRPRSAFDASATARSARAVGAPDERVQRTARLDPNSGTFDGMPDAVEDTETIRAIQRELRRRNYGMLVSDGVMRPVTRAAIMAYEHDHALPLTGEASEDILKRILLGASATMEPAAAARTVASARAAQVVRTVQELLAALRYQPGPVDGRLGDETLRAIREFEMDKGLPAKGCISADLMMRLTELAAAGKPTPAR